VPVDGDQILAFRVATQGLNERDRTVAEVAGSFALQDSPPGAALTALNARSFEPERLGAALAARELVALPNPRTAVAILPASDVGTYLEALRPPDERALKAVLLNAAPGDYEAAREHAVTAVGAALDGRVLSRDALHEELRGRLPKELLPWCPACESHHARRGLLSVAALEGRLCITGREGRQNTFARTDQWIGLEPADGDELARRYLHHLGPSTHTELAGWAGIAPSHAKALLKAVEDELAPVGKAFVLAADLALFERPPPARGTRLLGPGDPLLTARDRAVIAPDKAVQRRIWRPVGSPGVVLHDGRLAGLWRARKQGRRLTIDTDWLREPVDISAEAERLAALRGAVYEAA
jgi:Winged helix DNA-binding domain